MTSRFCAKFFADMSGRVKMLLKQSPFIAVAAIPPHGHQCPLPQSLRLVTQKQNTQRATAT